MMAFSNQSANEMYGALNFDNRNRINYYNQQHQYSDRHGTTSNNVNSDGSIPNWQVKLKDVKKLFHKDRYLFVKHLPRNVTKNEIGALFPDLNLKDINIHTSDDTSSTADVLLHNPEMLDVWDSSKQFLLRGQNISVSPIVTNMVLCVAKLPLYFTEEQFYNLIKPFGDIRMYFLMLSEKTGKTKGYGFVKYARKEQALTARNFLNDRVIDTFRIVCDWLDSSHLTFASLHSRCLYVDKLPKGVIKDMYEFRKIFSAVINPPYCQIALKNGCLLDWGLVEYKNSDDAELVQTMLNGFRYRGHKIRVLYYIPGVRAINLYLQLLTESNESQTKSTGLLPEPTGQSVMMSIQSLSKQNPIFAENLRNIILNQIQESQMPKNSHRNNDNNNNNNNRHYHQHHHNKDNNTSEKQSKCNRQTDLSCSTVINNLCGAPVVISTSNVASSDNNDNSSNSTLYGVNLITSQNIPLLPNPPSAVVAPTVSAASPSIIDPLNLNRSSSFGSIGAAISFPSKLGATPNVPAAAAQIFLNDLMKPIFPQFVAPAVSTQPHLIPYGLSTGQISPFVPNLTSADYHPIGMYSPDIFNILNGSFVHPGLAASSSVGLPTFSPAAIYPTLPTMVDTSLQLAYPSIPIMSNLIHHAPLVGPFSVVNNPKPLQTSWPAAITTGTTHTVTHTTTTTTTTSASIVTATIETTSSNNSPTRLLPIIPPSVISPPTTPIAQSDGLLKRKLLPSPESSPEGNYIGQHSQGIGGHYADSYFKRKKII